jgi:hypothetical protein
MAKDVELEYRRLVEQNRVLRQALSGMLGNYIELKRISLIYARSDAPNWMPSLTENDDIHVIAARAALAATKETP